MEEICRSDHPGPLQLINHAAVNISCLEELYYLGKTRPSSSDTESTYSCVN